jgi:alpha-D-ribose 1-methylphosphonate 5-phosphate C-P lyase
MPHARTRAQESYDFSYVSEPQKRWMRRHASSKVAVAVA